MPADGSAAAHQPPPQQSLAYEPVCAIFRRYLHGEKLKFTPERAMMLDAVMRKEGLICGFAGTHPQSAADARVSRRVPRR